MTKDIRRYELVEGTSDDEAEAMKQQMRVEEAQRLRAQRKDADAPAQPAGAHAPDQRNG